MKDPLQNSPTPYEVLGVGQAADSKEILRAFGERLRTQPPSQAILQARSILSDPEERALVDLLVYDDSVVARLGGARADSLRPPQRESTAEAWRVCLVNTVREGRLDPGVVHTLAVLWYWRAAESSPLEEIGLGFWERATAYWAATLWHPDFLDARFDSALANKVRAGFHSQLAARFREAGQSASKQSQPEMADCYRRLGVALQVEWSVNEILSHKPAERLFCPGGPLLCREMGILDRVQHRIRLGWAGPSSDLATKLRVYFSPYAHLELLVSSGPAGCDKALKLIAKLTTCEKKAPAVRELVARASLILARDIAQAHRIDQALDHLKVALDATQNTTLASEIRKTAVEIAVTVPADETPASLSQRQAVLEKALDFLPESAQLKAALAEVRAQRARHAHG